MLTMIMIIQSNLILMKNQRPFMPKEWWKTWVKIPKNQMIKFKNSWKKDWQPCLMGKFYLILSCSWHQTTNLFSPNPEYFINKILCYDVFNDAVKCILRHLQELEKVGRYQYKNLAENKKWIDISLIKFVAWWIGGLMSRTRYLSWSPDPTTKYQIRE